MTEIGEHHSSWRGAAVEQLVAATVALAGRGRINVAQTLWDGDGVDLIFEGPGIQAPRMRVQVSAIRTVADGGSMIDAQVVERLITERRRVEHSLLADLTPRELETLSYVARGLSNQAIADELYLSKRAIEKHVNAIFVKLNLTDAMDASVSRRVKAALLYLAERGEG